MFKPCIKKLIGLEVLEKFEEVKREIALIPDVKLPSGKSISCHMVCRILAERTSLEFHDGYFEPFFEHSWLMCGRYIIDPYPIGVLDVPILLETEYRLPWRKMYRDEKLKITQTMEFKKDLRFLTQLMELRVSGE